MDYKNNYAEIEAVCTHNEYRRRGLAQAVIMECMRRLRDEGVKYAYISGYSEETISLYGKFEFVLVEAGMDSHYSSTIMLKFVEEGYILIVAMLTSENIDMLVKFEQEARISEPDVFTEDFDANKFREETLAALKNSLFISSRCMLCNNENQTIGRIDFSIVSSFSFGGNLQVYVDWIYVLKAFRRQGIARLLFSHMETYIKNMGIFEYFLLTAENSEAQSFYHSIESAEIKTSEILRKYL